MGQMRPVVNIEDLANLEDDEIREIISRLGRDKLPIIMKIVSEHFSERFQANMPTAEWQALAEAIEEPVPLTTVETAQARLLQFYRSDDPLV
jgi:flagellar motor switch protein FliG